MNCFDRPIDPPTRYCPVCDAPGYCDCDLRFCSTCIEPLSEWEVENGLAECWACRFDAVEAVEAA